MAITGEKFLNLSDATSFTITQHALDRLNEHAGFEPTHALASCLFEHSKQVKANAMPFLGYRPRYQQRRHQGEKSWYFRFMMFGQELIAVISEGARRGEYFWVTTYGSDAQTELLRVAAYEDLVAA